MLPRQKKVKGVYQYQISFIRNVKGTTLTGKEEAIVKHKKIPN